MLKGLNSARVSQLVVPVLLALAPVATILLTYPVGPDGETSGRLFRGFVIPVLAVELFVAVFALLTRFRRLRLPRTPWALAWGALATIAYATAFLSAVEPPAAIIRTLFWTIHVLFGFALYQLAASGEVRRDDMLVSLLAGFVLAAIALLAFTQSLADPESFDWVHDLPGYDHLRRIGYYSAAVAGLCLGHFATKASARAHAGSFLVSALALALIFWSGSRGALLAYVAAYLAMLVLIPAMRRIRPIAMMLGSMASGAAFSFLLVTSTANMGLARTIGLTTSISSGAELSSGRTGLWTEALAAFLRRPIFGYGESQTHFLLPTAERLGSVHPHNAALQFLLAWGLAGALLIVILSLPWLLRTIKQARRPEPQNLPWLGGILALLFFSAIDGTLFHVMPLAIIAVCVAMAHRPGSVD